MSVSVGAYVCATADVPLGEGRAVTIEGRRIAIFNTPTGWYALDHACPHRGGPLADGIVSDSCVTCPLHERRYDLATGLPPDGGEGVVVHEVEIRDGEVMVRLAGAPSTPAIWA
jgi:nitrite reductase (NADH) small subunit